MFRLTFFVPGPPKGKARARAGNGRHYTPKVTVDAERGISWAARKAMVGSTLVEGAVYLEITALFERPKSWPKSRKVEINVPHINKPDWDNVGKLVSDALNGIVWRDDSQVAQAVVAKRYADVGAATGLFVTVSAL